MFLVVFLVVFLEAIAVREKLPRFAFTLSPAFPTPLLGKTRIKVRRELILRKQATGAARDFVSIHTHSLGIVIKTEGNDTAIVDVMGIEQVELQVEEKHMSLVIDEVDCFKYLGLNLDHGLRMEEATTTGVRVTRT